MISPFIRAIPGWFAYHVSEFFKLLRSRELRPPKPEFIHLINAAHVPPAVNGKPSHASETPHGRVTNWQSRPRSH